MMKENSSGLTLIAQRRPDGMLERENYSMREPTANTRRSRRGFGMSWVVVIGVLAEVQPM
jgi:hypothetical protein